MIRITTRTLRNALTAALAIGPLCTPLSHAAASPADVQNAWSEVSSTISAVLNSNVANTLRTAHEQLRDYQFRTVYEFTRVSKAPLPGTRLALQPLPTMSQLDAELYLNSVPAFQQNGGIPALNCPVAKMGGAPGRTIAFTVPGSPMSYQLTDTDIRTAMRRASPQQGEAAYQTYLNLKNSTCAAIYNVAQLNFRYKKLQDMQANLAECTSDGAQISGWSVGQGFDFPGGIHRTVQAGGGLMYKCGAVYNGNADDALGYSSWFKFSDDQPMPLNLWKLLKESGEANNACPQLCVTVVNGGSLTAGVCMGVDPGISAIGDTVPIRMGVKFHYRSRDKEFCTPKINVPAPFGVAQSLNEMADNAMQQKLNDLQNQLLGAMTFNVATTARLKQLAALLR